MQQSVSHAPIGRNRVFEGVECPTHPHDVSMHTLHPHIGNQPGALGAAVCAAAAAAAAAMDRWYVRVRRRWKCSYIASRFWSVARRGIGGLVRDMSP